MLLRNISFVSTLIDFSVFHLKSLRYRVLQTTNNNETILDNKKYVEKEIRVQKFVPEILWSSYMENSTCKDAYNFAFLLPIWMLVSHMFIIKDLTYNSMCHIAEIVWCEIRLFGLTIDLKSIENNKCLYIFRSFAISSKSNNHLYRFYRIFHASNFHRF